MCFFSSYLYSDSPKGTSFEEQQKFVAWNNLYNDLQDRKDHIQKVDNQVPLSSHLSLSMSLSSSKSSYEQELHTNHYSRSSPYRDYIIPEHHQAMMRAPLTPQQAATVYPHCDNVMSSPQMQSTPIKSEDKVSGVDYRNIESIVNGGSLIKRDDIVRNSVIKRAVPIQEQNNLATNNVNECCCKQHRCCKHEDGTGILEKTKMLSDILSKSSNPLLRHFFSDFQYNLKLQYQNMWQQHQQPLEPVNNCARDLRARCESNEMEQELPLDLTINK